MGYKRARKVMKKILFLSLMFIAFAATSCKTLTITDVSATCQQPSTYINTATVADLEVSNERISFTFQPSMEVRLGGDLNVIKTAIREALRVNGGGDILVNLEYITVSKKSGWGNTCSSIHEITVSGYPAKYKNFRNLNDSIWAPTKLYPENVTINKTSVHNKTSLQSVNQSINSSVK